MTDKRFVYVISDGSGNAHKIGIAKEPEARLKQLQTGNPADLELAFTLGPTAQFFDIETWCHRKLKAKRLEGEWFRVSRKKAVETVKRAERAVAMTRPRPGAAVFWAKAIGVATIVSASAVLAWAFTR